MSQYPVNQQDLLDVELIYQKALNLIVATPQILTNSF